MKINCKSGFSARERNADRNISGVMEIFQQCLHRDKGRAALNGYSFISPRVPFVHITPESKSSSPREQEIPMCQTMPRRGPGFVLYKQHKNLTFS